MSLPMIFWVYLIGGGIHVPALVLTAARLEGLLLLVAAAWSLLLVLDRVGSWTGAGFRLSVYGFVAWWYATFLTDFAGAWIGSLDSRTESAVTMLWLVRNTALIVFGVGLGQVAFYSVREWRRRTHTPAWTRGPD